MPAQLNLEDGSTVAPHAPAASPANLPTLVEWEASREAEPGRRWREELSTLEAMRLMNEVRCFGRIPFQLSGRPLLRADVGVLVEHGARVGLSVRLAPGPEVLQPEIAADLRDAGLSRLVLDGDGHAEAVLLEQVASARSLGLGVHVSTTATPSVLAALPERGRAYADAGVHVWTLVFPVEGGPRGHELDEALRRIVAVSEQLALQLEVAGAPQIARVLAECGLEPERVQRAPREGRELLYIAADGSTQPAGELPLVLGNVRHEDVVDLYRDAPVLCALRDPQRLKGKCRVCEFVYVCGGSRARAHAAGGDWLAPDPACSHRPAGGGAAEGPVAEANAG